MVYKKLLKKVKVVNVFVYIFLFLSHSKKQIVESKTKENFIKKKKLKGLGKND